MQKKHDFRPFIGLHKEVLFGSEWAALSPAAKCLYLLLKGKRNPAKREEVKLSYRELLKLKQHGLRRPGTISRAFKELETSGWIKRANPGGLFGSAQFYLLSGRVDRYGFGVTRRGK
jgi:hypothetical protein